MARLWGPRFNKLAVVQKATSINETVLFWYTGGTPTIFVPEYSYNFN